jgi:hypothetical protein
VMSPGWHFGFRRALAIVLLTVIVGLVFASVRDHRLLYLVLISLGGLWLMGPWQLSDWVAALARHGSKGTNWVRNALQASCLCYAVYRREQRLVKAVRREELARQWVADRLSVIRGEMEVQRNRAAIASRLLTDHQQTLQQKREEVFNAD